FSGRQGDPDEVQDHRFTMAAGAGGLHARLVRRRRGADRGAAAAASAAGRTDRAAAAGHAARGDAAGDAEEEPLRDARRRRGEDGAEAGNGWRRSEEEVTLLR